MLRLLLSFMFVSALAVGVFASTETVKTVVVSTETIKAVAVSSVTVASSSETVKCEGKKEIKK